VLGLPGLHVGSTYSFSVAFLVLNVLLCQLLPVRLLSSAVCVLYYLGSHAVGMFSEAAPCCVRSNGGALAFTCDRMLASLACATEALIHLVLQSCLSLPVEEAHYQGVLAFVPSVF
jgi:hypothetical protein